MNAYLVSNPTIVIASGATDSAAIDLQMATLCGVYIPATFTGATISFKTCSTIDGTYSAMEDGDGAVISKTATDGKYIRLLPTDFAGFRFLKIVSASAEGADRTLILSIRTRV